MIIRSDFVTGTAQVVAELVDYVVFDLLFRAVCPGHEDSTGNCLCALDALRVVVCDLCCGAGQSAGAVYGISNPAH